MKSYAAIKMNYEVSVSI